jgi:cell division protein YceG involved in septum cleavage
MVLKSLKAALAAGAFLVIATTGWMVRALSAPTGDQAGPNAPGTYFEVKKGWSARVVIDRLAGADLVRTGLPLRLACRLFYPDQSFKAGEYVLAPPLATKAALF